LLYIKIENFTFPLSTKGRTRTDITKYMANKQHYKPKAYTENSNQEQKSAAIPPGLRPVGHLLAHWATNPPGHCLLDCWASAPSGWPPLGRHPTGPPFCRPLAHQDASLPLACWHTGHSPLQEDASITRRWLQICLGDSDKQDWMLKD
jgi:hypothetical protein